MVVKSPLLKRLDNLVILQILHEKIVGQLMLSHKSTTNFILPSEILKSFSNLKTHKIAKKASIVWALFLGLNLIKEITIIL